MFLTCALFWLLLASFEAVLSLCLFLLTVLITTFGDICGFLQQSETKTTGHFLKHLDLRDLGRDDVIRSMLINLRLTDLC